MQTIIAKWALNDGFYADLLLQESLDSFVRNYKTKKAFSVHNISKFMSLKNKSVIRTMSILEYDFCHHLEYDDNVLSFSSQPTSLTYHFNNCPCRYTPDFLVLYQGNISKIFEIKHSSQLPKSKFRERYLAKKLACSQQLGTLTDITRIGSTCFYLL